MDREQVIATLRGHEAELQRFGVPRLYLFGSVARVDVQDIVHDLLGEETDVMTRASLHPMLRPRIEAEALRVF
jgi:predicted nucleotidyltransferase